MSVAIPTFPHSHVCGAIPPYDQTDLILKDVSAKMNGKLLEIENSLQVIGNDFINDVLKESQAKRDKFKKSIANRECEVAQYENVLSLLEQDLKKLRNITDQIQVTA